MDINWSRLYSDSNYSDLKKHKDFLYDMIIGELNRISVSDDFEEKEYLLSCLRKQIDKYYDVSVECTKVMLQFKE